MTTADNRQKIIDLRELGMTVQEISNELNIPEYTIRYCMKTNDRYQMKLKDKANLTKKREDIWNKCKDLLEQGYDYKYICENIGISSYMFYNLMHLHNYNYSHEYELIKYERYLNKPINTYRYNVIKEMLINGSTYKEIGSKLGISKERIRQLVMKFKLSQYCTH